MRYCQACHRCYNDGVEFCLFDQTHTCEVERLPLVIEGKYRLEQLIAHGGMGSVYRATHLQLEREVAIKILRAEYLADEKVIERFKREARAAARLKHPHVIAVYDFGVLPAGGAYLVMELVEGRSLREEMRASAARNGQLRCERAVALMRQACAGVEAAHSRGIIHRDLKPDNIMIEAEPGGGEVVKVLDFGIAKLRENGRTLQGLTDEGVFIGTPNYISPEQCTSLPVDARSDVYSLGVILYEMLTGRVPFGGGGTSTVLLRHLQEPPAPPSRFRPEIGGALEQVLLRALAKNPNQRFDSAAHLGEHLAAALRADGRDEDRVSAAWERAGLPLVISVPIAPEASWPAGRIEDAVPTLRQPRAVLPIAREPRLLLESPSRARAYFAITAALLALLGAAGYGWGFVRQPGGGPEELSDAVGAGGGKRESRGTPPGASAVAGDARPTERQAAGLRSPDSQGGAPRRSLALDPALVRPAATVGGTSVPASLVRPEVSPTMMPEFEAAQRELQAVYAAWTASAARGDWRRHLGFYAERVDYYRDGLIPRARVEERKRRTFRGLDSYALRFAEAPQIYFKSRGGEPHAELVFDKQWTLGRGRRRAEGKARTLVSLRRDALGWRIHGERQLKLYYSTTRVVKR